ncbi:hypothetical protein [Bradyrhizobium oligotrophicum]|uniref:hypothetical protein n=1 Tax=Bradyrhizobium oligotrophicum TaxID=44255 RepID=UPI003EBBED61
MSDLQKKLSGVQIRTFSILGTWLGVVLIVLALGVVFVNIVEHPTQFYETVTRLDFAGGVAAMGAALLSSAYLGLFKDIKPAKLRSVRVQDDEDVHKILREVRNYIVHSPTSTVPPSQINIDEEFKGQLLARLTTESQNALASFVEGEVFKKAAEADIREKHLENLNVGIDEMLSNFAGEMNGWRKNANINLIIGLGCAIIGIGVMWQTLVALTFDVGAGEAWRVTDLYRFVARFALVLIIESVAFFFLKLYREDRNMIRYFRNEITNLESRYVALKAALDFGLAADISKVLQSLSSTERNFLVKKGDRVISDIGYENSEILVEKILARLPEIASKIKPTAVAH